MNNVIKISEDEFKQHCNNYDGVCLACHEWTLGGCEPDAENYHCEDCGEDKVMGAEQALLEGHIEFED